MLNTSVAPVNDAEAPRLRTGVQDRWLPLTAALHDVQGLTIEMKTGTAGHMGSLIQKSDHGPFSLVPFPSPDFLRSSHGIGLLNN
jgi:hypothetical protein